MPWVASRCARESDAFVYSVEIYRKCRHQKHEAYLVSDSSAFCQNVYISPLAAVMSAMYALPLSVRRPPKRTPSASASRRAVIAHSGVPYSLLMFSCSFFPNHHSNLVSGISTPVGTSDRSQRSKHASSVGGTVGRALLGGRAPICFRQRSKSMTFLRSGVQALRASYALWRLTWHPLHGLTFNLVVLSTCAGSLHLGYGITVGGPGVCFASARRGDMNARSIERATQKGRVDSLGFSTLWGYNSRAHKFPCALRAMM